MASLVLDGYSFLVCFMIEAHFLNTRIASVLLTYYRFHVQNYVLVFLQTVIICMGFYCGSTAIVFSPCIVMRHTTNTYALIDLHKSSNTKWNTIGPSPASRITPTVKYTKCMCPPWYWVPTLWYWYWYLLPNTVIHLNIWLYFSYWSNSAKRRNSTKW